LLPSSESFISLPTNIVAEYLYEHQPIQELL
jgi:hypothetical protein